jgi:carbon monoxide dehydrogenase subunit G
VRVERTRTVDATPDAVWDLVSDPWMLPRWWPRVQRVEEATPVAWTKVLKTPRGKTVRADYTRTEFRPPYRIAWQQELAESPFEAILEEALTEVELEPDGDTRTRVAVRLDQQLRGRYRAGGGFLLRRATRRQLDEALAGIERAVVEG